MKETTNKITAIYHSRRNFYNGKPIYWYEFKRDGQNVMSDSLLAGRRAIFIRVPETKYFEYGGTHEEALLDLTESGSIDILEGVEI